jgi:AcrR family transcriptional regulator
MTRKRAAKRAHILETAMRLVADGSLAALTMQRLAAALDLTAGALYRYFSGKDALIAAMQRHALVTINDRLRERRAAFAESERGHELSPATLALFEVLDAGLFYVELHDELPEHIRLISNLMGDPRRLVDDDDVRRNSGVFMGLFGLVDELFETAASTGALRPGSAPERTVVYWSSMQGIVQLEKLERFAPGLFDVPTLGLSAARTLLIGWGADPELVAAAESILERRSQS